MQTKRVIIELRRKNTDYLIYDDVERVDITATTLYIVRSYDVRILQLSDLRKVTVTSISEQVYEF